MNVRGLSALGLLLVAMALERFAYYGTRAFLALEVSEREGMTARHLGEVMATQHALVLLGTLVGGAVALAIGPRATAAVAALVAAIGHVALAAGASIAVGAGVVGLGAGLLRPCPIAAAAATLAWDDESPAAPPPHRFAAVAAFDVLSLAAINTASAMAPVILGALRQHLGSAVLHGVQAGVMILAAVLAGIAAALGVVRRGASAAQARGPYRDAAASPVAPPVPPSLALGGVALLLVPHVIFSLGQALTSPPYKAMSEQQMMWLFSIDPIVVGLVSMALFVLLLVATTQRWSVPPLLFHGAGLLVAALGLLPLAFCGDASIALYVTGSVITGLGEPATIAISLAYAAIAVRGRAATMVVAVWSTLGLLSVFVRPLLGESGTASTVVIVLCALLCIGSGAAILALGRQVHRRFFDPAPPAVAQQAA